MYQQEVYWPKLSICLFKGLLQFRALSPRCLSWSIALREISCPTKRTRMSSFSWLVKRRDNKSAFTNWTRYFDLEAKSYQGIILQWKGSGGGASGRAEAKWPNDLSSIPLCDGLFSLSIYQLRILKHVLCGSATDFTTRTYGCSAVLLVTKQA